MKSRQLAYPQALVMLATLMIPVGLTAQERGSARTQNPVSLIDEPLLPEAALSAESAVTVDGSLNGTGESSGSNVTLLPPSLTFFCAERVGFCDCSLPQQTVTLTNDGTGTLKIARIGISGSNDFSETNSCGTMLGPGESCGITVSWNRVTASAKVKVSDNASDSPQTASLRGTYTCTSRSGSSRTDP